MSKKKDNGDDGLKGILSRISNLSQLNDLLSNMDEEEMMRFYDLVSNNTLTDQLLDDTWYSYNRPDYSSMAKPLAKWLLPLAKVANLNEVAIVSREAIEKAASMDRNQMENDLRNYIYAFLAAANGNDRETFFFTETAIPLIAAFQVMAKYQLTGLLDAVFETLKQNSELSRIIYLNGGEFIGSSIIYELGKNQMEKIVEFLCTQGIIPMVKTIAFDALVYIYFFEPKLKLTALHHITTYLQQCYEIGIHGGLMTNVDHYAATLAKANVREVLPLMKKIYANCDIPYIEVDGYNDMIRLMNDKRYTLHDTLIGMDIIIDDLDKFATTQQYDDYDDDFDEDDFYYDDSYSVLEDSQPQKCLTLKITLNGTAIPVERSISLPSNIYLNSLEEILEMLADWWGSGYDYEFEKDGKLYVDVSTPDTEDEDIYYTEDYTLQELLRKKGDTMTFRIWKGKSPHWENTITVTGCRDYRKSEKRLMKLVSVAHPYPTDKTRSIKAYETKVKKRQMDEPNPNILKKDLQAYEEDNF